MLPGLMPVPAILAVGIPVAGAGIGTPIGLLLTLTKEILAAGVVGTPIGILLTITKEIPTGGSGGGGSTAGEGAGLLLALTKAS
jgi:hypothetical protein